MILNSLFSLFLLLTPTGSAQAPIPTDQTSAKDIIGNWQAVGYFYNDDWIQPENLKTTLIFEFFEDGTNRLFWKLINDPRFCERKGKWTVSNGLLHDEVIWVNPDNGLDCGGDPDMQLGSKASSEFWRNGDQLFVKIPFSSEFLIYVWQLQVAPVNPVE